MEAIGFNGDSLFQITDKPEVASKKDSLLSIARKNWENQPENVKNIIWLGRRTAYKYAYNEAIQIYSEGLKKFPDNPQLLRHRGHRYISIRAIDKAIADLEKAAIQVQDLPIQLEPDGIPNKLNIPLSNLQFNIYYHLGLAYYMSRDWKQADKAFASCMSYSDNPDLQVATADWWYMTKQRLGDKVGAKMILERIPDDLSVVENESYYKRIQFYKGLITASELMQVSDDMRDQQLTMATQGYGLGNWYLCQGELKKAQEIFHQIIRIGSWTSFGHIAAEADLVFLEKAIR